MSKRKITAYTNHNRTAVVYWNSEFEEYSVTLKIDGKIYKPAEYFTNDKTDALQTAQAMINGAAMNVRANPVKRESRVEFNWGFHDGIAAAYAKRSYHSIDSNKVASTHYKSGWRAGFNHFKDAGAGNIRNADSEIAWREYSTKKNPGPRGTADVEAAKEIAIWAENEHNLYNQRIWPIVQNLARKRVKGTYDEKLALKLWKYAADDAAKRYSAVHGGTYNVPTRLVIAQILAEDYAESVKDQAYAMTMKKVKRNPAPQFGKKSKFKQTLKRVKKTVKAIRRSVERLPKTAPMEKFVRVQYLRGGDWFTLAMFPNTETGKTNASQYAREAKRKYTNVSIRVII